MSNDEEHCRGKQRSGSARISTIGTNLYGFLGAIQILDPWREQIHANDNRRLQPEVVDISYKGTDRTLRYVYGLESQSRIGKQAVATSSTHRQRDGVCKARATAGNAGCAHRKDCTLHAIAEWSSREIEPYSAHEGSNDACSR